MWKLYKTQTNQCINQWMYIICLCVSVLISAYQIHARMGFTSFSSLVTKHKDWSLHILKKSTTPQLHNDTSQWLRFWGLPKAVRSRSNKTGTQTWPWKFSGCEKSWLHEAQPVIQKRPSKTSNNIRHAVDGWFWKVQWRVSKWTYTTSSPVIHLIN